MFNPTNASTTSQSYDIAALTQQLGIPKGVPRPSSSLSFSGYNSSGQPQAGTPGHLPFANGGPPQHSQAGAPSSNYAWQQPQQAAYGAQAGSSSSAELQNQLAQQAAMQSQHLQRQQFAQQQQQQQQQASQYGTPQPQSQSQTPSHPSQPQQNGARAPLPAEWANLVATLTPDKFNALAPQQQATLREYYARQKIASQQQLGLGYPGPPGGSGVGSPSASGSPAPGPPSYARPPGAPQQQPGPQPGQQQAPGTPTPNPGPFLKALSEFHQRKGVPFPGAPVIEGKMLDLQRLYTLVMQGGGFVKVQSNQGLWRSIVSALGYPVDGGGSQPDARVAAIVQAYHSVVYPFEQAFTQVRLHQQQQQLLQQHAARNQAAGLPPNQPPPSTGSPFPSTPQQLPPGMQPRAASFGLSQPPMAGSPFASSQLPMAMQQQRTGTPSQAPPVQNVVPEGEDRKGKGKAKEEILQPGKKDSDESTPTIDTIPLSSSPFPTSVPPSMSIPPPSSLDRPKSSGNAPDALYGKRAAEPPGIPPRRKRQKIEYVPLQRTVETYASWDLGQVEDVVQQAAQRKRPRTLHDLGTVDVHSLTMSLKSRLGSEVTYALNTLTLISLSVRTSHTDHQGLAFPLAACGGLVDELLDLLEETAFGVDGEFDDNKQSDEDASASAPLSYRELFRVVTQEETELAELPTPAASKRLTSVGEDGLCPLEPIDTILVLTNLLRNFAIADENVKVFGSNPRVLAVLVRVANLPLRRDGVPKGRWPLQVTAGQSMAIRKDVLETITNFAIDVRLDTHSSETAASLFRLLLFFVLDADHQDQLYFDLSTSPSATSRMPQAAPTRMSHYLDIGLAAFARVTTPDVNRYIFAEHAPVDMFALFESLVHLLPITESEFQLVTSEPGLIFAESLATSLYNLAFLAPPELKVRLRVVPGFIRAFLRVVKRLIGTTTDPNDNPFVTLCDHCIATLTLLSQVGGMSPGGQKTSGGLWFGLGPLTDETEKPSGPAPTEADRASAKARQPPKSGGHPAPAVLSGDPRQIFDLLSQGLAIPFTKLSALLDASSGKKE